jgi:hypothetical protein
MEHRVRCTEYLVLSLWRENVHKEVAGAVLSLNSFLALGDQMKIAGCPN